MEPINLPAHLHQADSLAEITVKAKSMADSICHQEESTQEMRVNLGALLVRARQLCKQGEWEPFLAKCGIVRQRAFDYMKLIKCPEPDVPDANSTQNEENFSSGDTQTTCDDDPKPGQTSPIICPRCQRCGQVKDCAACAELRKPKKKMPSTSGPSTQPAQPPEPTSPFAPIQPPKDPPTKKQVTNAIDKSIELIEKCGQNLNRDEDAEFKSIHRAAKELRTDFVKWLSRVVKEGLFN